MKITDEMVDVAWKALDDALNCKLDGTEYCYGDHTPMKHALEQVFALSHAAGQDGEQCRAASGEPDAWLYEYEHDGESDHCLSRVRFLPSWVEAKRATENPLYLRALSRGAPEGFPGEFDTLRAFAVEQHEAFDRYCAAIAAQRKEGE